MKGPVVPLPPLSPVEAGLVVVGLRSLITRKVERVTKAKLERIGKLDREIYEAAKKLVAGEEIEAHEHDECDYEKLADELTRGVDVHQIQEMAESFPPEMTVVGHALLASSSHIIAQLRDMLPKSTFQGTSRSHRLRPPDEKWWKFTNTLKVLDKPLSVFELISTGKLLRSEARAIRFVYPTLSKAIDAAIALAQIDASTDDEEHKLPEKAQAGLCAWLDQPPMSPDLMQAMQNAVSRNKAERAEKARVLATKYPDKRTQAQSIL